MPEYTLYCFAQSGNCYKPALALELAGADWAPRFVDYFSGETRTPAYRAINVMGEAPVLEHRGRHLSQSGVILDYLAESLGRFGAADAVERREILRWLLWDNHKLTSYTATLRFMRTFAKDADPAVVANLRVARKPHGACSMRILPAASYVVGDRLTIADLSLCGYLFWPEEIGVDWEPVSEHPRLARAHPGRAALGPSLPADARPSVAAST